MTLLLGRYRPFRKRPHNGKMKQRLPKHTVVILELYPVSNARPAKRLLRVCASGVGRDIDKAERAVNEAIQASEHGGRHLVMLHRTRARRIYSKATSLDPIDDVVTAIHGRMRGSIPLPMDGLFEIAVHEAVEAIEQGLIDYPKERAAKERKRSRDEKRRRDLATRKKGLKRDIAAVVYSNALHSPALRDALDAVDGEALRNWAEKELERQSRARNKEIASQLKLREMTVARTVGVSLDLSRLRDLQDELSSLGDLEVVLSEGEEFYRDELSDELEEMLSVLHDWQMKMPKRLYEFAEELVCKVGEKCPPGDTLRTVATRILIREWTRDDLD